MRVCLNDLYKEPESPAGKTGPVETFVRPQNTLGVSSLCVSIEDRLRAAGKSIPTLAKPIPPKDMMARIEKSGNAVPNADADIVSAEMADYLQRGSRAGNKAPNTTGSVDSTVFRRMEEFMKGMLPAEGSPTCPLTDCEKAPTSPADIWNNGRRDWNL